MEAVYKQENMNVNRNESHPFDSVDEDLENQFEHWTISNCGDIEHRERTDIVIPQSALLNQNWLTHILKKVSYGNCAPAEQEFYFVYLEALKRAGYRKITIDLEDPEAPVIVK